MELWYIFDPLSGGVVDDKHFTTKMEAVHFRNKLGYGYVKSFKMQEGGEFDVTGGKCPMASKCKGCG